MDLCLTRLPSAPPQTYSKFGPDQRSEVTALDDNGFHFVTTCIAQLEGRGLEEQGLYRVVGVSSKVSPRHGVSAEGLSTEFARSAGGQTEGGGPVSASAGASQREDVSSMPVGAPSPAVR